jgi:hypothetical protein
MVVALSLRTEGAGDRRDRAGSARGVQERRDASHRADAHRAAAAQIALLSKGGAKTAFLLSLKNAEKVWKM